MYTSVTTLHSFSLKRFHTLTCSQTISLLRPKISAFCRCISDSVSFFARSPIHPPLRSQPYQPNCRKNREIFNCRHTVHLHSIVLLRPRSLHPYHRLPRQLHIIAFVISTAICLDISAATISAVNLLPLHFFYSSVSAALKQTLSDGQTISSEAKLQCMRIKCVTNCFGVGMRNSKKLRN